MPNSNAQSVEERIAGVVHRLLTEHSIDRDVAVDEDLRQAGLSSLDMVSLATFLFEDEARTGPRLDIPAKFTKDE